MDAIKVETLKALTGKYYKKKQVQTGEMSEEKSEKG